MIRFIFSILQLIGSGFVYGQGVIVLQDKPFVYKDNRDTAVWNQLQANSTFRSLPTMEQEFFYWSNLMRKNPASFSETVVKEFLNQFPEANSAESKSLITDLKQTKSALPFLLPDEGVHIYHDYMFSDIAASHWHTIPSIRHLEFLFSICRNRAF